MSLLGVWLESIYTEEPEMESEFVFDMVGAQCPILIKETMGDHLRETLSSEDVTAMGAQALGNVGTHSLRKYGITFARGSGCSKEDVYLRARWKSSKPMQDAYADTTIPYVNCKMAATLCRGRPITYLYL